MVNKKLLARRAVLMSLAGLTAAAFAVRSDLGHPARASAVPGLPAAVKDLIGSANAKFGKVHLDVPDRIANGNTVPLSIRVDSPMAPEDFVKSIYVVAPGNRNARAATFTLSPLAGVAAVGTRIRLEAAQTLSVVAVTSKGEVLVGERAVDVEFPCCGS